MGQLYQDLTRQTPNPAYLQTLSNDLNALEPALLMALVTDPAAVQSELTALEQALLGLI